MARRLKSCFCVRPLRVVRVPGNDEACSRLCSALRLSSRSSRVQPELLVWVAEGPRCQPRRMARDRSMCACSFCSRMWCFDASWGLCAIFQPWITPSLFDNTNNTDIVDEWTFGQLQDRAVAEKTLKAHWDSWITEADFVAIAAAGFVRASSSNLHIVDEFAVFVLQLKPREATDRVLGLGGRPWRTVQSGATSLPPQRREMGSCQWSQGNPRPARCAWQPKRV